MKSLSFPMILLAFLVILSCSFISAFTSIFSSISKVNDSQTEQASQSSLAAAAHKTLRKRQNTTTPSFNAHAQYIDVSGAHAFVPPNFAAGDLRGPCPALNALANHGYLPHNGFATVDQLVTATNVVFGMGLDLSTVLAVYGLVMDGNPLSLNPGLSIGGIAPLQDQNLLGNLLGLLGTPDGLTGSHNKYEADASPTRGDLYQYGNDYLVQVSQFETLFDLQPDPATANYDMAVMAQLRKITFERSIANNPYFFYGVFTGMEVSNAAHSFIYRFFANHTIAHPEGILNQDLLKTFFSISGDPGSFAYKAGYERIPTNWYRRAIGDDYGILALQLDVLYFASQYPNSITVGGNTGKVNTFTPLDFEDLTGGVYNALSLLEGNNLACFVFQAAQLAAPDVLKGLYTDVAKALSLLNNAIDNVLAPLECPELESINLGQLQQFPGYRRAPYT